MALRHRTPVDDNSKSDISRFTSNQLVINGYASFEVGYGLASLRGLKHGQGLAPENRFLQPAHFSSHCCRRDL